MAFDYNGDGHMDLFVTSMFGRCQLYRNNGNGTFTDVTLNVLGRTSIRRRSYHQSCDLNNHGRLDLFVVDMHSDMWMGLDWNHKSYYVAEAGKKKYRLFRWPPRRRPPAIIDQEKTLDRLIDFQHEELIFGNTLFRNDGGGKFREVSDPAGLKPFGRAASPPATPTTTARRTSSSPPAWATRSTTGPTT